MRLLDCSTSKNYIPHRYSKATVIWLCLVNILLSGCISTPEPAIDALLTTGSISQNPVNLIKKNDEQIIAEIVKEYEFNNENKYLQIVWANSFSGSNGVIEHIQEKTAENKTCRIYHTTRHGFDGVKYFEGAICTADNQKWHQLYFKEDN